MFILKSIEKKAWPIDSKYMESGLSCGQTDNQNIMTNIAISFINPEASIFGKGETLFCFVRTLLLETNAIQG